MINRQQLIKTLQQEISVLKRLMLSLDLEQAAISEDDIVTLGDIVQTKLSEVNELEMLGQHRDQLVKSMQHHAGDTDDQDSLFRHDPLLSPLWSEFITLAEQCQQKNRINGSVVETASRHSRHALAVLNGVAPAEANVCGIYDNSGHADSHIRKRTISHV